MICDGRGSRELARSRPYDGNSHDRGFFASILDKQKQNHHNHIQLHQMIYEFDAALTEDCQNFL